jgi:hypothetical protein
MAGHAAAHMELKPINYSEITKWRVLMNIIEKTSDSFLFLITFYGKSVINKNLP